MHDEVSRANEQLTEARPPDLVQAFRSEIDGVDPSELAGILQKLLTAVYKNSEMLYTTSSTYKKGTSTNPGLFILADIRLIDILEQAERSVT